MLERGIHEEHILEMLYDDRDMVATPVKRGRGKAPAGTRPILLMGNSSRGALEVGVNFDPARKTLWVFHVNMLQDKYRYMYDKLRGQL